MKRYVIIGLFFSFFCLYSEQSCITDVESLRDEIQELQKDIKELHIDAQDIERKFQQFEEDIAPFKDVIGEEQFFCEPENSAIQLDQELDEGEEASEVKLP